MKKTKISLLQVTYYLLTGITLFACNQNTSPKNEGAKQTEKVETKNCYFSGISTDSIFLTDKYWGGQRNWDFRLSSL
jgi:hypothetical protein